MNAVHTNNMAAFITQQYKNDISSLTAPIHAQHVTNSCKISGKGYFKVDLQKK